MSLPEENKRALKATHKFMTAILGMKVSDFRKMGQEGFDEWRRDAYWCIKHYPFDCQIDSYFRSNLEEEN